MLTLESMVPLLRRDKYQLAATQEQKTPMVGFIGGRGRHVVNSLSSGVGCLGVEKSFCGPGEPGKLLNRVKQTKAKANRKLPTNNLLILSTSVHH